MKANFKLPNGKMTFEVIAETAKEIWAQVAQIEELFCAETACGLCDCTNLRYGHRIAMKGNKPCHYYELVCRDCGGQFGFGQRQDTGELFPKRRDLQTKQPYPNGGWRKWEDRGSDPDEGNYDPEPQARPPQAAQQPPRQNGPVAQPRSQQPPQPALAQRTSPQAGNTKSADDLPYERQTGQQWP